MQAVWEADLSQGLVRVPNLDATDVYHRGIVTPLQVVEFAYIVPSEPGCEVCIICIDLVLSMGWVD